MKSLKEFKKEINALGYISKTNKLKSADFIILKVLDKNSAFIVGSGVNAYNKETIQQHNTLFDLINSNRNKVFENDFKVLF